MPALPPPKITTSNLSVLIEHIPSVSISHDF
jgi:hypothetical protein